MKGHGTENKRYKTQTMKERPISYTHEAAEGGER